MMIEGFYILLASVAAISLMRELLRHMGSNSFPFFLKTSVLSWIITVTSFGIDSLCRLLYTNNYRVDLFDTVIVYTTLLSILLTLVGGWQYANMHNDDNLKGLILRRGLPFLVILVLLRLGLYLR